MSISEREVTKVSSRGVELPEAWRSVAVVVVLPTYQEAASLPKIIQMLMGLPLPGLQVLVVDDNSPDGTGALAEQLAAYYGRNRIEVAHRPGKEGLGKAYIDGMTQAIQAGAEFVVQMDADLSHGPEYLPGMLGTLLSTEADVVIGSRYIVGASVASDWPWHRKALSAFANAYVRVLLHLGIRDVTAGYKVWRSAALKTIDLRSVKSNGYSFQVEMNYRARLCDLKVVELPIHFVEREAGKSKMTFKVQLESAIMPFQLRRYVRGR